MKKEERIVRDYLVSCGYNNIAYEPDGNVPPDFSVNSTIGVEVRRLNQNYFAAEKPKGLERDHIKLYSAISGILGKFDEATPVKSYGIALRFTRPIGNLKAIKNSTRFALRDFLRGNPPTPHEVQVARNVSVTVIQAGQKAPQRFRIGIESDLDGGGWLIPMYIENIQHCIQEKSEKIHPYRVNYKKWWLLLVDALLGISQRDIPEVIGSLQKPDVWDRIVIVDPTTRNKRFEI